MNAIVQYYGTGVENFHCPCLYDRVQATFWSTSSSLVRGRSTLQMVVRQLLELTENSDQFDISLTLVVAVCQTGGCYWDGISRALLEASEELRPTEEEGFSTRDARVAERKNTDDLELESYQFSALIIFCVVNIAGTSTSTATHRRNQSSLPLPRLHQQPNTYLGKRLSCTGALASAWGGSNFASRLNGTSSTIPGFCFRWILVALRRFYMIFIVGLSDEDLFCVREKHKVCCLMNTMVSDEILL